MDNLEKIEEAIGDKMNIIAQVGKDCEVTLGDVMLTIKLCNATKLANTFWDKEGEKYTVEQMEKWGFVLKEKNGNRK